MDWLGPWLACCWLLAQPTLAHREHKVHNIVLYPDKESWCKTTPIKQVVTWASCLPQELDNNVCVGACFSYMVPHSEPSAPGDLIRPYCDSCQPLDSIWHTVTLQCRDKDGAPTSMHKKVQIITNCSCSSCAESERIKPDLNSLLHSLELQPAATPTANITAPAASSPSQTASSPPPEAPARSPPTEPTDQPPEQHQDERAQSQRELPDLLLDPNLAEPNRTLAPHTGEPSERLLRFLQQLERPADQPASLQQLDQLAGEEAGAKELLTKLGELLHKYRQPEEPESEALPAPPLPPDQSSPTPDDQSSPLPEPPSSVPTPLPSLPSLPRDDDDEEVPSLQDQQIRVAASLLHRTGPHHSLVLDPGVKEKIDVDSHYLHPALAGQEISYHDNLLLDKNKKKGDF